MHTMGYYLVVRKNENMRFIGKWVGLEKIILCEVTQTPEKPMTHILFHKYFTAPNLPM